MLEKNNKYPIDERANMRGGSGTITLKPLSRDALPANARLFSEITIPAGASIGYHVHDKETELFYFLEGFARVRDDDTEYDVYPGDVVSTPDGHGHMVQNIGDTPVKMIAVIIKD